LYDRDDDHLEEATVMNGAGEKKEIVLCMGSSCFARGNAKTLEVVRRYIEERKLHARIFLKGSRCEEKCSRGPVVQVGSNSYERVTPESVVEILRSEFPEGGDGE